MGDRFNSKYFQDMATVTEGNEKILKRHLTLNALSARPSFPRLKSIQKMVCYQVISILAEHALLGILVKMKSLTFASNMIQVKRSIWTFRVKVIHTNGASFINTNGLVGWTRSQNIRGLYMRWLVSYVGIGV